MAASPRRRRRIIAAIAVLAIALPLIAAAQRFRGTRFRTIPNVTYNGQFTFVRTTYAQYGGWAADYPTMETNLNVILKDITKVRPHEGGTNVMAFDDPELMKYPIAYLSEPGYWFPTDDEVAGLRLYLQKGGFLIADDFHFENEWAVFERAIRRVLPEGKIERLPLEHPVFNSFFLIKSLAVPYPGRLGEQGLMGEFFGIHEDNDPKKPLMVVINYNIDLGDYVEWSADNLYNPLSTNEAYKFMINYIVYGFTH
jgi:hypothetical protein